MKTPQKVQTDLQLSYFMLALQLILMRRLQWLLDVAVKLFHLWLQLLTFQAQLLSKQL